MLKKALVVAGLTAFSGSVMAQSQSNNMVNIVTVQDACDIVAIGVDFGVTTAPIPAGGVTAAPITHANVTANAAAGNASTGHPDFGLNGPDTVGEDDTLSLNLPIAALAAAVDPVVAALIDNNWGVFVACTVTPTSITLTSGNGVAAPAALAANATTTFAGQMVGVGGGAGAGNLIDYTLDLTGVEVAVPAVPGVAAPYIATFLGTGTIPDVQTGTIVPGFYTDVAVATVNY